MLKKAGRKGTPKKLGNTVSPALTKAGRKGTPKKLGNTVSPGLTKAGRKSTPKKLGNTVSPALLLTDVTLDRFKAAAKSGPIELRPFNVVIGRNGAGKSTLLEALQWIDRALREDIRVACDRYHGIHDLINVGGPQTKRSFGLELDWKLQSSPKPISFRYTLQIGERRDRTPEILKEELDNHSGSRSQSLIFQLGKGLRLVSPSLAGLGMLFEDSDHLALGFAPNLGRPRKVLRTSSISPLHDFWSRAVFLRLSPNRLAQTSPARRKQFDPILDEEGQHLPALLNELNDAQRRQLVKWIQDVLHDITGVEVSQPESERDEQVFYSLIEQMPTSKRRTSSKAFPIPAWMLSEGTRRITALFALLVREPPPSLLCIEEIENGLDPWTLVTILRHLQSAADRGIQVIVTTHSPWLLDHVELNAILHVRRAGGETRYERFADRASVKAFQGQVPAGAIYVHDEQKA